MLFEGIHHVSVNVVDTAAALVFYRDVLGMAELQRPAFPFNGAWLDAGEGRQVHLIEGPTPPDYGQHFAVTVTDLDATIAALRAAGIDTPDAKSPPGTAIRQTSVRDPSGNRIKFTQLQP